MTVNSRLDTVTLISRVAIRTRIAVFNRASHARWNPRLQYSIGTSERFLVVCCLEEGERLV